MASIANKAGSLTCKTRSVGFGNRSLKGLQCETKARFESVSTSVSLKEENPLRRYCSESRLVAPAASKYAVVAQASTYKVAVLGAGGGIGQPLSLLLKMSPLVSDLRLYDIANVKGVAADLSHCNTPATVCSPSFIACTPFTNTFTYPVGTRIYWP